MTVVGIEDARAARTARPVTCSDLQLRLLGPLEVMVDGVDRAPTAPKVLQLLALLAMEAGRTVPLATIAHELWGSHPPRSLRTTVQTYVYQLRRLIIAHGLAADAEDMLATRAPGYVLRVDPDRLDVTRFTDRHRQGQRELAAGRGAAAADTLAEAIALWSGPALVNVTCGPVLTAHAIDLAEQLRDARHLHVEAAIASGAHRTMVGQLRARAATEPLDEDLHSQLIRVLARSGRRSEAMKTYRDLRTRLVRQLGVEPSGALQSLHLDLLSDAS